MKPKLSVLAAVLRRDYRRHGSSLQNPALWTIAVYRFGVWAKDFDGVIGTIASKAYGVLFLGIQLTTGSIVNREAAIGDDLHIVHFGNIRIHPDVVIGDRCGIMHDVTLGTNMDRPGAPRIGNDVFIGAGARVLGPIEIGDGARIASNSLVLCDVPAGATAVGVPARILQYTGRPVASVGEVVSPRS